MTKKIFILFVIVILAAAGGVHWFLSRNNVQVPVMNPPPLPPSASINAVNTSDWLTFRSEKFRYEVKYSGTAEQNHQLYEGKIKVGEVTTNIEETINVNLEKQLGTPVALSKARDDTGIGFAIGLGIDVIANANPDHLSIHDWVYQNVHEQKQAPSPDVERDITFLGVPAYYFEVDRGGRGGLYDYVQFTYYFFHNSNVYRIGGIKLPVNPSEAWKAHPYYHYLEQSVPISEAIIKSFRFTDMIRGE